MSGARVDDELHVFAYRLELRLQLSRVRSGGLADVFLTQVGGGRALQRLAVVEQHRRVVHLARGAAD